MAVRQRGAGVVRLVIDVSYVLETVERDAGDSEILAAEEALDVLLAVYLDGYHDVWPKYSRSLVYWFVVSVMVGVRR